MNKPKSWKEITVNQYKEFREIIPEDFDNLIDYQIEQIAVICSMNPLDEFFDELTTSELIALNRELSFMNTEPPKGKIEKVKDFYFIGAKGWTLGQFIDLTSWCENDFIDNIELICASVYRKQKTDERGEIEIEPYHNYDKVKRSKEFEGQSIADLYGVLVEVLDYRKRILDKYAPLFNELDEDENEDEGQEIINALERIEEMKRQRKDLALKKYSWERFVYLLCDSDITRYKDVLRMPLIYVFNTVAMKKEFGI